MNISRAILIAAFLLCASCQRAPQQAVAPAADELTAPAGSSTELSNEADDKELESIVIDIEDLDAWREQQGIPADFSSSIPAELQFSCAVGIDGHEHSLAERLRTGAAEEKLRAAKRLWQGRSRRHAADVLKYLEVAQDVLGHQQFNREVRASLEPEAINKELTSGNYAWGSWLATLRPHASLVPALLNGLTARREFYKETIVALGKSRDRRALEPLQEILRTGGYMHGGFAADSLGELGFEEAEPALLAALPKSTAWDRANICIALGRIGTAKSLEHLEPIAVSKEYTGAIAVRDCAQRAVEQIKSRNE